MTKKVLLTGAAGFIGSHLVEYILTHTDWNLVCLDRLDSAGNLARLTTLPSWEANRHRVLVRYHDLRGSISKGVASEIVGPFGCKPFDYILHLAAGSHVDRSREDPILYIMDNVVGTGNLLEFARMPGAFHTKTGKFLYYGTDEVFGSAQQGQSFKPWDRHRPLNVYAATKSGGEMLCVAYAHTFGLPVVMSKAVNAFGPAQHIEKFIPLAMSQIHHGNPVPVHTVDGIPCSRYYNYVENACSATVHVIERGSLVGDDETTGRYNFGAEVETDNVTLVRLLGERMGKPVSYELVENPPGRLKPDSRYDIDSSALLALDWKPPVTFEEGLDRTVAWFRASGATYGGG